MVKLKVSYEQPEELEEIKKLLQPVLISCRKSKNQDGKYLKAYIEARANREKNMSRQE